VISRFEDGKIVEDWSITDTSSLMRQLGVLGSLAAGLTWLRSRLNAAYASRKRPTRSDSAIAREYPIP
jgi:hypothetical protein